MTIMRYKRVKTHHFKPLNQSAEVGIFLVVLNERWLNAFPCTLDVHAGTVNLSQVHPLQVPQAPEENLHKYFAHLCIQNVGTSDGSGTSSQDCKSNGVIL